MTTPVDPGQQSTEAAAKTSTASAKLTVARARAMRAGRLVVDRAGQAARRASAPARTLVTALRGEGQTQGLRHLPNQGAVIIAANHRHALDARALAAALPRPVLMISTSDLEAAVRTRRSGKEPSRGDIWQAALDELGAGGAVAIFPEGAPSPDTGLHKGRDAVGRLVLAARVMVVPAVLDTRSALLTLGPALDFARFDDLVADRTLARGVTDQIMSAIADLGRLRYLDTYPTTARDQLRSAALKQRDLVRLRAQTRRLAEQQAIEARHLADVEERRDLARLHRDAEEQARTRAEQAAERDQQRRGMQVPGRTERDDPEQPEQPEHPEPRDGDDS